MQAAQTQMREDERRARAGISRIISHTGVRHETYFLHGVCELHSRVDCAIVVQSFRLEARGNTEWMEEECKR